MKRTVYLNVLLLLGLSIGLKAQQIVDVLPLTDRIVVVHFDEGFVTHHKRGQQRSQEFTTRTVLNVSSASNTASYQLSSSDDASYTTAKNPTSIGRKSKGTEWALLCESYDPTIGCVNTSPDHADEHWLYLYLPTALQRGKSYTLNTGTLGSNGSNWAFTYDEKTIHSEAVHVNQIGYKPNAALKFGYVYHWVGDKGGLDLSAYVGKAFWVVNTATNTVAFTGTLQLGKSKLNPETGQTSDTPNANFSSADVYECNFSALTTPGDYVLAVEGIGRSFPFSISQTIYNEPFVSVMNGLFKNRSGIAIAKGDISDQTRPAPHNPNLTPGFSNRLYYSTARDRDYVTDGGGAADKAGFEAGKKGLINTWGWYQDAGDWDGYPSHARIPINLMFLYENFPTKFTDNALKLAEKNNGKPDVLDEARWLLRFYHRTRHAIQDAGYGTGGVGGARVFGDYWGGDTRADGTTKASWEDTDRDWYVSGEDVWTTYKYAGMAAHFAYCLSLANTTDPEAINWQQEAIDAYAWAKAHQVADDETVKDNYNINYDRLYSSAMLYRLTGTASYHDDFKTQFNALSLDGNLQDDLRFGLWAYTLIPSTRPTDAAIIATIRAKAQNAADYLIVSSATKRAARWGGDFYFPMLVGQASSPMTNEGFTAYSVLKATNPDKANEYLKYSTTTADYFLGNNPLNQTWVTGLGERYPKEIFHLDSWYSDEGTTRTGIVPYGPWRTTNPRPPTGWFDLHFPEKSLYPTGMDNWPGHERWFDQRTAPIPSEFTVHQTMLWSFMTYGFLLAAEEPAFQNVAVTGVAMNPNTLTLFVNQTGTLTATVQPANATNPAVTWSSSNTAVATVLGGAVTGVATGTATITARTVDGGFSASAIVTVIPAPAATCANNLFVNPGFEDSNLSAYFLLNSSVVGNGTHSGNKALLIGDGGYVNQQYYNAPQGTYTFRVWAKRSSSTGYALVQFKFVDADGNDIGTAIEQNTTATDAYQETIIGPVQAPANTSKILVGFPAGNGTTLLIDDLCLTNTPPSQPVSVSITASSTTLSCASPTVSLTASSNADSYVWNTGATTAIISVTAAGTYSVTATTAATSSTASITIGQDISLPTQPVLSSTSNGKTCSSRGNNVLTISPAAACSVGTIQYIVTGTGSNTGTVSGSNLILSAVGSYTVSATCGQAGGCISAASAPVSATIYADPVVLAPVAVTPNPVARGQVVTLSASVSSVAPIAYVELQLYDGPTSVGGIPSSSTASPYSATFTIPLSLTATSLSPNVYVADVNGCSVTRYEGILTINPANTAPTVANPIGSQTATVGQSFTFAIPANTFADVETPNSLTYSAVINPANGLSFSPTTGIVSGIPSQMGVSSVTVTATDPGSLSVSTSFSITIKPGPLSVLYRDADYGNLTNNSIKPFLQLANAGDQPIPYGELTLRYWFTSEGQAPPTNLAVYYAPLGAVAVKYVPLSQPRQGANGYVEYSFSSGGNLPANGNSGPIENGIQKTDGANFDESDDYSYQANYADYLPNARVTAYRNGILVWGQEPTVVTSQTAVQVYSAAKDEPTTSQIQTRLELRNTGNVALPVANLKLHYYFTSDNGQLPNVYVDYADLGATNVQARVVQLAQPVGGADSYVELNFPASSLTLNPLSSLGYLDFRMVRSDNGLFDQTNDYSYAANYGNVGLNPHVTAYLNNSLVFGNAPSGAARVAAWEPTPALSVRVLGNPVVGPQLSVEVRGAEGQPLRLVLTDLLGRPVSSQTVGQAGTVEWQTMNIGNGPTGALLLRVSTPTQAQTVKLIRAN